MKDAKIITTLNATLKDTSKVSGCKAGDVKALDTAAKKNDEAAEALSAQAGKVDAAVRSVSDSQAAKQADDKAKADAAAQAAAAQVAQQAQSAQQSQSSGSTGSYYNNSGNSNWRRNTTSNGGGSLQNNINGSGSGSHTPSTQNKGKQDANTGQQKDQWETVPGSCVTVGPDGLRQTC